MDAPVNDEPPVRWSEVLAAAGTTGMTGTAEALVSCWARTRPSDIAQRCVLAHYLADQQTTARNSLLWDLRALNHGRRLASDALVEVGICDVARILPSLHLNVAASYRRTGAVRQSRRHARKAQAAAAHLRGWGGSQVDHPLDAATEHAIERLIADLDRSVEE